MTVNTNLSRVQYNGNGVTTAFAFGNRVTDPAQLSATRTVIATSVDTPLILNDPGVNGFSVAGVPGSSVTVNTIAAPASGTRLTIYYNMPFTQTADYVPNDSFPAETHEGALDKLTIICQQQQDSINRALKFAATSSTALTPILPVEGPIDGAVLAWSGTTGAMKNGPTTATILATVTAATAQAVIATTQAGISTTGASTATTQAGIATTQAGISTTQAGISTTGASTATTQAGIATAAAAGLTAVANAYQYSTTITMADPGTGFLRLNNATIASATALAISVLSGDSGNPSLRNYINTWDDSTTTGAYGYVVLRKSGSPGTYAVFLITSVVTDNTTWQQMTLSFIGSSGAFANNDTFYLEFKRTGDKGATGGGGDCSTNTASSVDSEIALFSSTTGKIIKRATGTGYVKVASGVMQTPAATVPLTDLATQAALTVLMNATNGTAAPTAVAIGAAQLVGANAGGTALGPITLGTGMSMSGTTLNGPSADCVLLSTQTASASASIDFTAALSSTYNSYLLVVTDYIPSTAGRVWLRVNTGGGYISTATYTVAGTGRDSASNPIAMENVGTAQMDICSIDVDATSTLGNFFDIKIFNPSHSKTTHITSVAGFKTNGLARENCFLAGGGFNTTTSPVTGIQVLPSTGTITSGTFKLYGLK